MSPSSPSQPFVQQFELRGRGDDAEHAERALLQAIEQRKYERASVFAIRLALEEALTNAFKHGNKQSPDKIVRMACSVDDDTVVIEVEDQGEGFDPTCVPDPTDHENVEIPCGRGLKLMKAFMTELVIDPPGNRVRMKYVRPESE